MKTRYLTSLTTAFNPFSVTGKVPRLFLNLLPANAHKSIAIKTTQLPRTSKQPASLVLGFKDGKTMTYTWAEKSETEGVAGGKPQEIVSLQDVVQEVERHARMTGRKEELAG